MKKRNFAKIFAVALCLTFVCSVFAACGAANDGLEMDAVGGDPYEEMDKEFSQGSNITSGDKNEMAENSDSATGGTEEYEPKIIKTATVNAETKDFSAAVKKIETSVKELDGYVEQCNIEDRSAYVSERGSSTVKYASYVIRIPADSLDAFLAETGELLNILSETTTATDVSDEYYDIEARISVLETERAVLEKMLSETTSVSQMIEIEQRLYDVIYEIESYKTALKVYDSKVAYSTVNLTVNEVADLTPVNEDNTFGTRFKNAVKESWNNFVEFCQEFIIVAVYAAPAFIIAGVILAVILIVVLIIVLCVRRKRRAKKTEQ